MLEIFELNYKKVIGPTHATEIQINDVCSHFPP